MRGGGSVDLNRDCLKNTLQITQHIAVPESDYAISKIIQGLGPPDIRRNRCRVLFTVELYHQLVRWDGEIRDVPSYGVLSPNFNGEIHFPQRALQNPFGVCRVPPQIPGTACFGTNRHPPPLPNPLRPSGRRGNFGGSHSSRTYAISLR